MAGWTRRSGRRLSLEQQEADARWQQLFDEYVDRVYDARNDIARAAADLRFTLQREEAAQAAIPALERLADTYRTALGAGSVDALVAAGARQSLGAKRLEAERLRREAAALLIALELATGQPSLTSAATR